MLKSIIDCILSKSTSTKNVTKIISPPVQIDHELQHTVGNARVTSLDCWDLDRMNCVFVNLLITDLARAGPSDDA